MQWCTGRYSNLSTGFPQQNAFPGIQAKVFNPYSISLSFELDFLVHKSGGHLLVTKCRENMGS